jgi:hypothetical protein
MDIKQLESCTLVVRFVVLLEQSHNQFFVGASQTHINDSTRSNLTILAEHPHTHCAWAGGTFFFCLRKVPAAHSRSVCVVQELGW